MRNRLVIAWFLVMNTLSLEAGDPAPRQSLRLELPAFFRSVRPISDPDHLLARRRLSTFDLKLVVASDDNVVDFVPPMRAENSPSDRADGPARIDDPNVFNDGPAEGSLPPLATSPEPLTTSPKPSTDQAVPLDDVFRDKGENEKDDKESSPATERSSFGWIAGNQNHLGLLELDFEPLSRVRYDAFNNTNGMKLHLDNTFGARWLNGPNSPDLPPYLFNILINVGATVRMNDRLAVDAMISPGWYTDFSNKGVEAFRLPWHFVSFHKSNNEWQWVLGITDLSRRDIRLLPVAGFIYAPGSGDVRMDLVFPKPKVSWRIYESEEYKWEDVTFKRHEGWLYVAGELGGGSWAISRADRSYDVVTYRDYRLIAGFESRRAEGHASRIEVGWIFGRAVEYMSNNGNYNPSDSLMIRYSSDY